MTKTPLVVGALVALVAEITLFSSAASAQEHACATAEVPRASTVTPQLWRAEPGGPTGVTVYLDGDGGVVAAGGDDGEAGTSSLVMARGVESIEVPAYRGGDAAFARVAGCVAGKLAAFDVDVVTERPAGGAYITAMIGGAPSMLGYGRGVGGVAPWSGEVIPRAVVYVFERELGGDPASVCNAAAHEVGHALGLEHAYLCEDPMSYLDGCGEKTFQDVDAWCGEYEPRECAGGGQQNSVATLTRLVGLRSSDPDPDPDPDSDPDPDPDPDPDSDPDPDPDPDHDHDHDHEVPDLRLLSATAHTGASGERIVELSIHAASSAGLASLELAWRTPTASYLFRCGAIPDEVPASCWRSGDDTYSFALRVGTGRRAFALRATDRAGHASVSDPRVLLLPR